MQMTPITNNTMLIRWMLGLLGTIFVGIIIFNASSFSGELKELQKNTHDTDKRISVVETMIDNIHDDVSEIKGDVKETQRDIKNIDSNLNELKQMIMQSEVRRTLRESGSGNRDPFQP